MLYLGISWIDLATHTVITLKPWQCYLPCCILSGKYAFLENWGQRNVFLQYYMIGILKIENIQSNQLRFTTYYNIFCG